MMDYFVDFNDDGFEVNIKEPFLRRDIYLKDSKQKMIGTIELNMRETLNDPLERLSRLTEYQRMLLDSCNKMLDHDGNDVIGFHRISLPDVRDEFKFIVEYIVRNPIKPH
jgi:hypothetical protein